MSTTIDDCRLWLKSVQAGAFKSLFEVLKDIIHDVNILFDETGGRITCFDGARCAFIHVKLRAESFDQYKCDGKVRCGINILSIFKLLRACSSHDTIVMYNRHDATNELGVRISNAEKKSRTEFSLKLLDVDEFQYNIPSVEFDSVMTIPSTFFHRIIRDMYNLSQTLTITAHAHKLIMNCSGDFASQETVLGEGDDENNPSEASMTVTQAANEPVTGVYSLKYLNIFSKSYNLCPTMELYIKKEYGLVMCYKVCGIGDIQFLLGEKSDD